MDLLNNLILGFSVAFTLTNLSYCFVGVLLGTLIGVLPGLGPTATIAMLLPATFVLPPVAALIMLAGIYYGSQYGGSTTAILINLPGESASVVTAIDGYQMAKQGRAGAALAAAGIGSFFAGTVATFLIALFAPPLAAIALKFGPAEYFSLMILGLVASVALAHGSVLKALGMIALGLLARPGRAGRRDRHAALHLRHPRAVAGHQLRRHLDGPVRHRRDHPQPRGRASARRHGEQGLGADADAGGAAPHGPGDPARHHAWARSSASCRAAASILSSFAAYSLEKKLSRRPQDFGKGAIEGVAGPEAANNAGAQTSFIPMLTLGIPPTPVMALMVGAMIIKGIQPGPLVMTEQPDLFWGLIASMWIGNFMLIVLNLPLIGIWVRLLKVPYHLLFPAILAFCCIGVYSLNNNVFDVYLTVVFGLVGYILVKLDCEPAPLLLGFILGPMMEENLRRAMLLARGDVTVFVTRPISAVLLVLTVGVLAGDDQPGDPPQARGGVPGGAGLAAPPPQPCGQKTGPDRKCPAIRLGRAPDFRLSGQDIRLPAQPVTHDLACRSLRRRSRRPLPRPQPVAGRGDRGGAAADRGLGAEAAGAVGAGCGRRPRRRRGLGRALGRGPAAGSGRRRAGDDQGEHRDEGRAGAGRHRRDAAGAGGRGCAARGAAARSPAP